MWKYYIFNSLNKKIHGFIIIIVIFSILHAPGIQHNALAADSPPTPISPADGTETTVVNYPPLGVPEIKWSKVSEAGQYRLQISGDIGFANVAFEVTTPNTSYTPVNMSGSLFADGDWYWRVRVESPGPPSNYSDPVLFTKNWASDDNSPQLYFPVNGEEIDFYENQVFSWSRVSGAAKYRFQIAATFDGFNQPLYTRDTLAVSHQPAAKLANGLYYWRVVPLDPANHEGTSSEIMTFTLNYGSADFNQVPLQLEPLDNSTPTFTPIFSWTAVEGAEKYRLEYTSDPTCIFQTQTTTVVTTRNTTYTPTSTFPNDVNYCWRVRAESGQSIGEWSPIWEFQKQWYIQPVLLAPTNNYKYDLYPLYQWTPVPGASRYQIEIDLDGDFVNPFDTAQTANTFYTMKKYIGTTATPYYWRVKPIDNGGFDGKYSDEDSFQSYYTSTAPVQIYPFYYYLPNDPSIYEGYELNPVNDLTAPMPLFIWNRTTNPYPYGGTYPTAYRLQVSSNPNFSSLEWEFDTENTSAVPTVGDDFVPSIGQDYYWRVCPFDLIAVSCLTNPVNDDEWWSQIWKARFDPSLMLPPTQGAAPQLIRPVHGDEIVEATPLLEWWPYQDAEYYEVQISRDTNFNILEVGEAVPYPAFASQESLAQRRLGRLDYGTFYWRVRAIVNGSPTLWSDTWRFQIASQSEWRLSRTIGNPDNQLQVGEDDIGDVIDSNYDLTFLYAAQSNDYWFLGFEANASATDMTYGIFLDLDHVDGSGADSPPNDRTYNVSVIPAHQPEFAVFVDQVGGTFLPEDTYIYPWEGTDWGFFSKLSDLSGGEISYNGSNLELKIPSTAINISSENSSIALMVFSVNISSGNLQDTVPDDPNVPLLSRFTSVSEKMNLILPPDHSAGDPRTYSRMMPFFWDFPTGSDPDGDDSTPIPPSAPWAGSVLELHLDPGYSNDVAILNSQSNAKYFAYPNNTFLTDIQGDNTYYWRARPRYLPHPNLSPRFGSWNNGGSFEILEYVPQNLQTSVTFATPIFSWDMVEGAASYDLQVATDPSFGTGVVININTALNTFTPLNTLANDDYFWHVRIRRYGNVVGDWSNFQSFTLSLPKPTNLTPDNEIVHYAPTFCWDEILEDDPNTGHPVLATWKYHIQVSKDPTFSSIYEQIETEQTCYTPTKGYEDGTYYWHVAMIDGNNRRGDYSSSAQFTKQYPITTLISPVDGNVASTPTFLWTPVDGGARYRLEISQYSTFSPLYDSTTTINTNFTPTKLYELDRPYYWRVAIIDGESKYGPFNDATIIIGTFYPGIYLPLIAKNH